LDNNYKIEKIKIIINKNKGVLPAAFGKIILDSFEKQTPTNFELDNIIKTLRQEIAKVKKHARA
jgi:hypothetical protein